LEALWAAIGVSPGLALICVVLTPQVRPEKALCQARTTAQYGYGTETPAKPVTSTTPSECNGQSACIYHSGCWLIPSVFDVTYTPTADFVLSASDDGNVRIWKHNASDKIGPVSTKERQAIEYRKSLVDRWSSVKDVRSVKDRRHVPESIHNATKLKREMLEARNVKEDRRRKHTRAGKEKPKAERKSRSRICALELFADLQRPSSRSRSSAGQCVRPGCTIYPAYDTHRFRLLCTCIAALDWQSHSAYLLFLIVLLLLLFASSHDLYTVLAPLLWFF